ncbi:MAG: hypothetical protein DMG53_16070 [Acidobacteria bacterium]|nr:MAG: hypothetical protein DMG41_39110 [Acidobacteriota bacterium]PYU44665.1 MAG: hypothetical protein DMG53_16070 [Acidobacteriota bacterium]
MNGVPVRYRIPPLFPLSDRGLHFVGRSNGKQQPRRHHHPPIGWRCAPGYREKLSPDLFTGSESITVSLSLPPGRNGFKPHLGLAYSTGNGSFGLA